MFANCDCLLFGAGQLIGSLLELLSQLTDVTANKTDESGESEPKQ